MSRSASSWSTTAAPNHSTGWPPSLPATTNSAEAEPDPVLVLFVLPTHRREAGVRQTLTPHPRRPRGQR